MSSVSLFCIHSEVIVGVLLPVVSGPDVGQPCTPGGTPCADSNAACVANVCTCRQGFFSRNGFCSKCLQYARCTKTTRETFLFILKA